MKRHHLKAGPATCHWGYFDAKLKPVFTIASGDEITIESVSGGPDVIPAGEFHVPPELERSMPSRAQVRAISSPARSR